MVMYTVGVYTVVLYTVGLYTVVLYTVGLYTVVLYTVGMSLSTSVTVVHCGPVHRGPIHSGSVDSRPVHSGPTISGSVVHKCDSHTQWVCHGFMVCTTNVSLKSVFAPSSGTKLY